MSTFTPGQVAIGLVVLFIFIVPYMLALWWPWDLLKFAGASIGVVLLWRWARPQSFAADLGLRVRRSDFASALSALLIVGIGASCLIPAVLRPHGFIFGNSNVAWKFLAIPFQTLNEEMVLRALLLTVLAHTLRVRFFLSVVVAGIFVLLHFVFYRFGPAQTTLSATTAMAPRVAYPFAIARPWRRETDQRRSTGKCKLTLRR